MAERAWHQSGSGSGGWLRGDEPREATPIGDAEREPLGIYLGSTAMDRIERALAAAPGGTLAGLLLGYALEGRARPFVLVSDILASDQPPADDGELLFTPQALRELEKAWERTGTGTFVVGWFHGAPGGGSPLSRSERRTHERYFTEPWHIVLLIDTERKASRLYRWEESSLVACDNFYFWNSSREPASTLVAAGTAGAAAGHVGAEAAAVAGDDLGELDDLGGEEAPDQRKSRRKSLWERLRLLWPGVLILLLFYTLIPGAPGSLGWVSELHAQQLGTLDRLEEDLIRLEREADSLLALRTEVVNRAGAASVPRPVPAPAASGVPRPAAMPVVAPQATAPSQAPAPQQTASARQAAGAPSASSLQEAQAESAAGEQGIDYVIQPGDTMWRISDVLLGDPRSFPVLAEKNNISDPNRIFPGQRLRVP